MGMRRRQGSRAALPGVACHALGDEGASHQPKAIAPLCKLVACLGNSAMLDRKQMRLCLCTIAISCESAHAAD